MTKLEKEAVIKDYLPLVYSVVGTFKHSINDLDFDDMVQEVLTHLSNKLDKYDSSKSKLSTYIYTVSRNKLINMKNSKKNYKEVPIDFDEEKLSDIIFNNQEEMKELKEWLRKEVGKLSGNALGVMTLIMEGYTQSEVSRIVGLSRQRVSQIYYEFIEGVK